MTLVGNMKLIIVSIRSTCEVATALLQRELINRIEMIKNIYKGTDLNEAGLEIHLKSSTPDA